MVRDRAVLMNCLSSRSGGAVSYIRHVLEPLGTALAAEGIRLVPLIRDSQADLLKPERLRDAMRVADDQVGGPRRAVWEFRKLGRIARETRSGLVFTPYQMATLVPDAKNVVMLRNMEPFFSHNYSYSPGSQLRNEVLRIQTSRTLRRADATIAVSDFAASHAIAKLGVDARRVTRIYHGRDESFSPAAGSDDDSRLRRLGVKRPYVFTCGSLLPYRRLEDVIQSFDRYLAAVGEDVQLVVAGSGTDARYQALVKSAIGCASRKDLIMNLGQVDNQLMQVLYRQSRLFVTATEVEACPNIAIEAMSSGCAIIAADTPALRELLGDGAAYFVQRDQDQLAQQMTSTWKDSALRARMAAEALHRASGFSWALCGSRTSALLAALLG